jgi:hypothetical protein
MIFAGWRREASLSARRQKLAQDAYAAFFDRSIQYYAAGRFAFHSGLTPVAGNLLHHAVEMCLKGALSKKGFGLKQLYKLGHSQHMGGVQARGARPWLGPVRCGSHRAQQA